MKKTNAQKKWDHELKAMIARREQLGLTTKNISTFTGMNTTTVWRIFTGQMMPSVVNYFELREALQMSGTDAELLSSPARDGLPARMPG